MCQANDPACPSQLLLEACIPVLDPAFTFSRAGMAPEAATELGGSALRVLHCLAASTSVAQTLCSSPTPLLPPLLAALQGWGLAGSVLALDTLQRALVRSNPCRCAVDSCCDCRGRAAALPVVRSSSCSMCCQTERSLAVPAGLELLCACPQAQCCPGLWGNVA